MQNDAESVRRALRITCADAVELMTDHLEGALQPSDQQRFAQHLDGCTACAVYLDQLRSTVTVVGDVRGGDDYAVDEATIADLIELFRTHHQRGR